MCRGERRNVKLSLKKEKENEENCLEMKKAWKGKLKRRNWRTRCKGTETKKYRIRKEGEISEED